MEFSTDVFSLDRPSQVKFDLVGSKLPNSNPLLVCLLGNPASVGIWTG